jgi:hypothetical protein
MTRAAAALLRPALPLLFAAFVAACAWPPEEEFGECEPGVGGLSRAETVCP